MKNNEVYEGKECRYTPSQTVPLFFQKFILWRSEML